MIGNQGYGGVEGPTGRVGNKLPKGTRVGQYANYTPQQMELHNRSFEQVAPDSYTSRLAAGDQSMFGEIEAPALKQFSGLQGNMASRFSGMGSFGGRKTSGFQNASNSAASDFAMQLQSQRQGLQRQAIQDLQGMTKELLGQKPYEQFRYDKPQQQSNWGKLGGTALGAGAGMFMGMPFQGAALGYNIGSQFDNPGSGGGVNSSGLSGLDSKYGDFMVNNMPGGAI